MIYDSKGNPLRRRIGFLAGWEPLCDAPGPDLVASSEVALEREYGAEDGE